MTTDNENNRSINCLIKQSRTKSDHELRATIIIIIVVISNKNNRNRITSSRTGQPQLDLRNFASKGWKVGSSGKAREYTWYRCHTTGLKSRSPD